MEGTRFNLRVSLIAGLAAWKIFTMLRAREPLPEEAPLCVQEIAA